MYKRPELTLEQQLAAWGFSETPHNPPLELLDPDFDRFDFPDGLEWENE